MVFECVAEQEIQNDIMFEKHVRLKDGRRRD